MWLELTDQRVFLAQQSIPGIAAAGEYLVHTPGEKVEWTAQRPIDAPSAEVLTSPAVIQLRRRTGGG